MEIQLQELIDQIKKDGVAAAEAEAEAIVSGAREKAGEIIAGAKAEAEGIIRAAREENDRFVKSGEDAVRQAGRNLLISFRESVSRELTGVLGEEVKAVYSQDGFAELIARAVEGWAARPDAGSLELARRICKSSKESCFPPSRAGCSKASRSSPARVLTAVSALPKRMAGSITTFLPKRWWKCCPTTSTPG